MNHADKMNEERRKTIKRATKLLDDAENLLTEVLTQEQEAFDNLPESLQSGDKGDQMTTAIETLSTEIDNIGTTKVALEEIE